MNYKDEILKMLKEGKTKSEITSKLSGGNLKAIGILSDFIDYILEKNRSWIKGKSL